MSPETPNTDTLDTGTLDTGTLDTGSPNGRPGAAEAASATPGAGLRAHSGPDHAPSSGLLSFYDRLRQRVRDYLEERGGEIGARTAGYLLLVPDVLILLARLALDKEVPKQQRALIASALAYFLLPLDFLPEMILGPVGYLDDLVLAAMVLTQVFGDTLEPFTDRHWSGSERLRTVLTDIAQVGDKLVGKDVYGRLLSWMRKKGIDLD